MPRLRRVNYAPHHLDYMSTYCEGGVPMDEPVPVFVYELRLRSIVLVFRDEAQVRQAHRFFATKLRPHGDLGHPPYEHYWHPCSDRLPRHIVKRSSRDKLARALKLGIETSFEPQ